MKNDHWNLASILSKAARPELAFWPTLPVSFGFPAPALGVLPLWLPSRGVLEGLEWLWLASLATSALGLFTRGSTATAFGLGAYLLWIPHNFGKLHHGDSVLILALGILACARAGDAFSLDALRSRRSPGVRSGDYRWPLRMLRVLIAIVLVEAGLSKLLAGGVGWAASDNLSLMLVKANYRAYVGVAPVSSLGLELARHEGLCRLLAGATLLLELGHPVALVSRRAAAVLVPTGFTLLAAFFLLVVPAFYALLCCFVFWIPWRDQQPPVAGGGGRSTG